MFRLATCTAVKRLTATGIATGSLLYTTSNLSSPTQSEPNAQFSSIIQIPSAVPVLTNASTDSILSQVKPLAEASTRGMRLVQTVIMIVLEYKLESCKEPLDDVLVAWGIESRFGNEELGSLERIVKLTSAELQEKQKFYASKDKMDHVEKERRRTEVLRAAERLGRAEEELSQLVEAIKAADGEEDGSVHGRAARRIRNLCRINGGTYIKIGQHLANLDHLLPPAYCKTLSSLFG